MGKIFCMECGNEGARIHYSRQRPEDLINQKYKEMRSAIALRDKFLSDIDEEKRRIFERTKKEYHDSLLRLPVFKRLFLFLSSQAP